jgi:hypothetical protein
MIAVCGRITPAALGEDVANASPDVLPGKRTGFATWYSENTLGWVHWLSRSIAIRPEIRFDHSYAMPTYNHGMANSQLTAAADILIKF